MTDYLLVAETGVYSLSGRKAWLFKTLPINPRLLLRAPTATRAIGSAKAERALKAVKTAGA